MNQQKRLSEEILDRIRSESASIIEQWQNPTGTLTRHFVVDDLLPQDESKRIQEAFPSTGEDFFHLQSFREKKKTAVHLERYDPILSDITYAFQDPEVVDLIAGIIGWEAIEPDPKLYAGGLSMMTRGDFLNPHIDNSHDGKRERYRRLNLLYYVSPDWKLENGGNFELWDEKVRTPKTIVSKFNRLVVMETNRLSWHSVSPVVVDQPRCCVSNYYFSRRSPEADDYFHVTSYTGRPDETGRRLLGMVDNPLRNVVSKALGRGRGRSRDSED